MPKLDIVLDLDRPRFAGGATALASGTATIYLWTPDRARGREVWMQAAETGRVSNVVSFIIE